MLVLALPVATQALVRHVVARATEVAVASGDVASAVATTRRLGWLVDTDSFVWAYAREQDPKRRARLGELLLVTDRAARR